MSDKVEDHVAEMMDIYTRNSKGGKTSLIGTRDMMERFQSVPPAILRTVLDQLESKIKEAA